MSTIQIIYEDNHLIAVNKLPGALVQGDETGDVPLSEQVKLYIKDRYKKPGDVFLGVIHRLDRPVSGVVVFARTSKALERMNLLFKERKIEKTYWAIVNDRPDPLSARLTHFIQKEKTKNVVKAYDFRSSRAKDAKESILDYELIAEIGNQHLLEVKPLTGRPHQIRAQLSKVGYPIRGDLKYGHSKANDDASICLHCRKLAFEHPVTKERVEIQANPPNNPYWKIFKNQF